MATDKESLLNRIDEIVRENWERRKQPALLSYVGATLSKEGVDYKQHSPTGKLEALIDEHKDRYTLKRKPDDILVSGIVPAGETFEYGEATAPLKPNTTDPDSASDRLKHSRGALYAFVRELSRLPKNEADSVIIPTSVLIRLLEGK